MKNRHNKTAGFNLIELMIAMLVGFVIMAAVTSMTINAFKSRNHIEASAKLNQELGAVMAVMSNEIRRAGFNVCDENIHTCKDTDGKPLVSYALGEDLKVGGGGNCIEYRYNADIDADENDADEQRGFRLIGNKVQIGAGSASDADIACGDGAEDDNWVDLTDDKVFLIDMANSSFSTEGSKCRNLAMTKSVHWEVKAAETGSACLAGTAVSSCTDSNGGAVCGAHTTVQAEWVDPPEKLIGIHEITINLKAELTNDPAVTKILETSVKIENPWIGK